MQGRYIKAQKKKSAVQQTRKASTVFKLTRIIEEDDGRTTYLAHHSIQMEFSKFMYQLVNRSIIKCWMSLARHRAGNISIFFSATFEHFVDCLLGSKARVKRRTSHVPNLM